MISVIIPCRNGANYLQEAVAGIQSQNMPIEIIVVDDGSTDETTRIAESAGCRVVRHGTMRGQVAGKNTGIRAANGEYIMFHDHDDVMIANTLPKLYNALVADKNLWLVMAKVQDFFSPELGEAEKRKIRIREEAYHGLFSGAVLIRRALFDINGFFDESLNTGEIISLMTNMDAIGLKYEKVELVACRRRVHAANYGRSHKVKERVDYASVLRSRMRGRAYGIED
ncbi:MAG: glycosyltransferase family 2 protein [Desulfovibrio sp.]|jgi:glycosyltransferase involved in cell wall biosynthesis|nr:glycosyltransferase family 2 protein [Desulfovibrio sp.]